MIWHWDALNGSCDVAKNKVILCTWCNARVYTLLLLFYAPSFYNALIFTKRVVLKSAVCSDWPAIHCVVIGWIPQARDRNVTALTTARIKVTHLGGVMQIFPYGDVDRWGRVWIKHLVGVGICGGLQILYMHKQVLKDRVKPEVPSYEPFKISTEHFIS